MPEITKIKTANYEEGEAIMEKTMVTVTTTEYQELTAARREAELLKKLFKDKRKTYGGIKHEEVKLICEMFSLNEESEKAE